MSIRSKLRLVASKVRSVWMASRFSLAYAATLLVIATFICLFIPVHGDSEVATFTGWQTLRAMLHS